MGVLERAASPGSRPMRRFDLQESDDDVASSCVVERSLASIAAPVTASTAPVCWLSSVRSQTDRLRPRRSCLGAWRDARAVRSSLRMIAR